jgi:hypothetical protein
VTERSESGEIGLMAAVMESAIIDLRAPRPIFRPDIGTPKAGETREQFLDRKRKNYRAAVNAWDRDRRLAMQWIVSDEDADVFSFKSICLHLGLDPAVVRMKIGAEGRADA